MSPREQPPKDDRDVTRQLPGIKRYTRPETIELWQRLMDAHDFCSALRFAQKHMLQEQVDIARKAWGDEILKGQR
jgi:hypothetical protein